MNIDIKKLTDNLQLEIKITGLNKFSLLTNLGIKIINIGAKLLPFNSTILVDLINTKEIGEIDLSHEEVEHVKNLMRYEENVISKIEDKYKFSEDTVIVHIEKLNGKLWLQTLEGKHIFLKLKGE